VTKDDTTIIEGGGSPEDVAGRVAQIKREIETPTPIGIGRSFRSGSPSWPAALPSSRSAPPPRWSSRRRSIASRTPCRHRAAIEEGVVAGVHGTHPYPPAIDELIATLTGDEATGAMIVRKSLSEPLNWIAKNAGLEARSWSADRAGDRQRGSQRRDRRVRDLLKAGVIDPAK